MNVYTALAIVLHLRNITFQVGSLSLSLSVSLSLCLSVCLSLCLSVCLSLCLSVCLSLCLSGCLSVCLSVSLTVCLFVCPSLCLLSGRISVLASVCLFVWLSFLHSLPMTGPGRKDERLHRPGHCPTPGEHYLSGRIFA